jgi:PAS domain S-box-containing protein
MSADAGASPSESAPSESAPSESAPSESAPSESAPSDNDPSDQSTTSILLVDDSAANLLVLEAVLEPLAQRLVLVRSGLEALEALRREEFAVVLLDVMMPGLDGLGTAEQIRAQKLGGNVPIIFMTAGEMPPLEAYSRGAVDVLRKPLDREIVRAKVAVFVELFRAREQIRQQARRLQAQEHAAKARTAALLDASLDAVIGMDHTGRITEFNGAAERMFGHRRAEVLGAPLAELLIPADRREPHRRGLARYLATGESRMLDSRVQVSALRADGSEFPIELAIRRIAGEGPPSFLAYGSDLTARSQEERARTFLARASQTFAASLDVELALEAVARCAVPHVADWCMIEVVATEGGAPPLLWIAHVEPAQVAAARELRRRYPPDPDAPQGVPNVLRTGLSEFYPEITEPMLERGARDREHLAALRALRLRSLIIAPIRLHHRTMGAITFGAVDSSRRFNSADVATAEELGRRAAMALENAHSYRRTLVAEELNRFLAEATEALGTSLDYAATLERVTRLAVPRIADSAAVYRLEDEGAIRLVALAADSASHEATLRELDALLPLRIDQDRLLPRVLRTGKAQLLSDLSEPVRQTWSPTPQAGELLQQLAIRSYMVVPLPVRGRVFGALALTTSSSARRLGADDLSLAKELARRAGLAMENAQLYLEAQQANRSKDEFLATVSHELRTPLAAILAWLHLLRSAQPAQQARAIDTIERNARAQARIVDDLLDVSRIVTGKLSLHFEFSAMADVVRAVIETLTPMALAKGIELVEELDAGVHVLGDPARLQQVVWNLLSNALKFTGQRGRIEVRLERRESEALLHVSDTGQGISADFLPHVFEPFRQADSAATRAQGGLGLGLAIVRHVVEAHGGRASASSAGPGQGSRFTVALPLHASRAALQE